MGKTQGMIAQIESDEKLQEHCTRKFEDEGVVIEVDPHLRSKEYVGVKVDDYYNSLKPKRENFKTVDFVISVDCVSNKYALYIMEFKGTKDKSYTTGEIEEKFQNTIESYLSEDFAEIYCNPRYAYKSILLYLVTTANKKIMALPREQRDAYRKIAFQIGDKDTARADEAMSRKLFEFRGQYMTIEMECPPDPIIHKIT